MKIRIGEIVLELEPDHSASDVGKAKDEVERWRTNYNVLEERYFELARFVMNASHHKSLRDTYPGIENLVHNCFVIAIDELTHERDDLRKKYTDLREASHPNLGASHEEVLAKIRRRARK